MITSINRILLKKLQELSLFNNGSLFVLILHVYSTCYNALKENIALIKYKSEDKHNDRKKRNKKTVSSDCPLL